MEYERLKLTKDEVGVNYVGSSSPALYVPIHPKLLLPETKLDPKIPNRAFERAANEWYDDLETLVKSGSYPEEVVKEWRRFYLKKRPTVKVSKYRRQTMTHPSWWENYHELAENGFMRVLSISRNAGGTLGFNEEVSYQGGQCSGYIFLGEGRSPLRMKDSEKAKEFSVEPDGEKSLRANVYGTHNLDDIPGALMLRNWALAYMDEALKVVATED